MQNIILRNFGRFDQTLNYSSINEDSLSELKALSIQPEDVVLCITGSGTRTLDLLNANLLKVKSLLSKQKFLVSRFSGLNGF